jgi:HEAT repeat protein
MAIAHWIGDLSSDDAATRRQAAEALAHSPERVAAAIPLVRATGDVDETVREWAVAALEEMSPPAAIETAGLMALLAAPQCDVVYWSITLLGRLGSSAAPAVGRLAAILKNHSDIAVRQRAAWALGEIGKPASSAIGDLQAAAAAGDARLTRLAQAALAKIHSL